MTTTIMGLGEGLYYVRGTVTDDGATSGGRAILRGLMVPEDTRIESVVIHGAHASVPFQSAEAFNIACQRAPIVLTEGEAIELRFASTGGLDVAAVRMDVEGTVRLTRDGGTARSFLRAFAGGGSQ
jgi:hypothetical protein